MNEQEPLRQLLLELQPKRARPAEPTAGGPGKEWQQAALEVEARLGPAIRRQAELFRRLVGMQAAWAALAELDETTDEFREAVEDLSTKLGKVLEQVLADLARDFPTQECWQGQGLVEENKLSNAERLTQVALSLGFEVGPEGRLPDSLGRRSLYKIQNAARFNDQALNLMLVVTLLTASRKPRHPLALAARTFPDLLLRIDDVAEVRNKVGAHAGRRRQHVNREQLRQHVACTYHAVEALAVSPSEIDPDGPSSPPQRHEQPPRT
jgi:hypothetical protein